MVPGVPPIRAGGRLALPANPFVASSIAATAVESAVMDRARRHPPQRGGQIMGEFTLVPQVVVTLDHVRYC